MAYEKYIKKDGKIYGPYIYHSRRVDGKVISEYHGVVKKDFEHKKFLWVVLGILIVVALVYFSFFPREILTGRVIVNLEADYQETQPLGGKLRFSLKEGELIPASSKIVFENKGVAFEYDLRNVVSGESVEGNFYVEGLSVSGTGEGYGILGERQTFPTVYFVLSVLSQEEPEIKEPPEEIQEEKSIEELESEEPIEQVESPEGGAPITGGVISNFFGKLTGTGNVVIKFESEVEGEVSAEKVFTYALLEGETAELKPRSVRTDSKKLSDDEVDIRIEGNEVIVTTGYSESEEGFGEDYLGGTGKDIIIDLSKLNLILEPGELKIRLIHEKGEIISLTTILGEGEVISDEIIPGTTTESPISENTEAPVTETNLTTPINLISEDLTDEERAVLISEFGTTSLEVKEAKSKKGFIIIRYELGDYWVEYSYKEKLDRATLESFMGEDRVKWLKDIAKRLSREQEPEEEIEEFLGNYSV